MRRLLTVCAVRQLVAATGHHAAFARVLSTLQIAPLPAGHGVGDLSRELAYMRSRGGPDPTPAQGTEPFRGPLLP